jgi:hypothetical protein
VDGEDLHTNKFKIRRDFNLGNGMVLFKVLKSSLVDGEDQNIKKLFIAQTQLKSGKRLEVL